MKALVRTRIVAPLLAVALLTGCAGGGAPAPAPAPPPGPPATGYTQEYVALGDTASGVLYRQEAPGPNAGVGLVLMHPNSDFRDALACHELAERGFTALCVAGRYVNTNREEMVWEKVPLDLAPAVTYLRERPGIRSVVLVGHSGGGQLMPFYQNVAQNGVEACRRPERIVPCTDELAGLPPADGLVLLDAHHGYGANTLTSMDAAVTADGDPRAVDPALDMYAPQNGYGPDGSTYAPEFVARYLAGQAAREERLVAAARAASERVAEGAGRFPDAEPFTLVRGDARLWQCDVRLVSHTRGSYPVLRADGSATVEVARTVRVPSCDPESNASFGGGAIQYTAEAFLSSQSIRTTPDFAITEDDIRGVDWASSNTSTPANLEGVTVPLLVLAMTGHYWMVSSEIFYEHAASTDKELAFVEGATHGFTPCTACAQTPDQFGDTVRTTFDHVGAWLGRHYGG
jgi:hypothetical protein